MKTLIIILVSLFIAFMLYQIKETICPTNRTTYGGEQLSCSQYQKLIRDIEEQTKIQDDYYRSLIFNLYKYERNLKRK